MSLQRSWRWLLVVCLSSLNACQSGPLDPETTEYYRIPTGSTLTLHTAVSIPPGTATIYIQAGKVQLYRDIRRYYPHCALEVKTLSETTQIIQPDEFTVQRSYFDEHSRTPGMPLRPARRARDAGSGPSHIEMQRVMQLYSPRQPDVFRLICLHWAVGPIYDHLLVKEVRKALGGLMTLTLARANTA